jgi:hypothetical protein
MTPSTFQTYRDYYGKLHTHQGWQSRLNPQRPWYSQGLSERTETMTLTRYSDNDFDSNSLLG